MSLKFVYGRSGSGKTHFCLNEIRTRHEKGSETPLILLVPEQFTFQAEKLMAGASGRGGILGAEVLSFRRMAFRIFNETGGLTKPNINAAGKAMIIHRLLEKNKGKFRTFHLAANKKGFVEVLASLVTEFKRYNVGPDSLLEFAAKMGETDPLGQKIYEVSLIYNEFNEYMENKYRNPDDDLTVAAKKLANSDIYEGAEFWIDGFSSFTPQEYLLAEELIKKAKSVTVSLCTDSLNESTKGGLDVFADIKNTKRKLIELANKNSIEVENSIELNGGVPFRFRKSVELAHLEKFINKYPYEIYEKSTEDIKLFESINIYSEIEACANEIIRLCRDEGMKFREIGMAAGNLNEYARLIETIFKDYQIPFFFDKKHDISEHPLIKFVLSLMSIFVENWSYQSIFGYLKTGLAGIPQVNIDKIENYVLAHNVRGGKWIDQRNWEDPNFENINDVRNLITAPLMIFRNKTKGRHTAAEMCGALYDFLIESAIPSKIEENVRKFKEEGKLALSGEYAQVWDTLMDVFDQTVEVMADEKFGIERFSEILAIGLSGYKTGLIPVSLDQVIVGNIERSRSSEVKALFILGANDGQFPSKIAEEGILNDIERSELKKAGIELSNDTHEKSLEERFIVYRALSTASHKLWISWSLANRDGGSLRASLTVSSVKKLFPNINFQSNVTEPSTDEELIKQISSKKPVFNSLVRHMRRVSEGYEVLGLWKDIFFIFFGDESWKEICLAAIESFGYRNSAGPLSAKSIGLLYSDELYASVSRIEKYASCPFAYFASYVLKAEERRTFRPGPPDVGSFLHGVIETFSKRLENAGKSWRELDHDWCDTEISEIVTDRMKQLSDSGLTSNKRYTALTKRLKNVAKTAVITMSEQLKNSEFQPVSYEAGFGDGEKIKPLEIILQTGEKIKLSGRIDRIDAMEKSEGTYIKIIDYKSGDKDFNLAEAFNGFQVQLIAYLAAILNGSGLDLKRPLLPAGVFYFHLDDPIIRTKGRLTKEEAENEILMRLRPKGIILEDPEVIKGMDSLAAKKSTCVRASINKDGTIGKNGSVLSAEKIQILSDYTRLILKQKCEDIMDGKVSISPYKNKKKTACEYCEYKPLCQFDANMDGNEYRNIRDIGNDKMWETMKKELQHGGK